MTLHEEITQKRQEYFATATPKQKLSYLLQYYGLRTLLICAAVIFIVSWICHLATAPERILTGTFVNYNLYNTTLNVDELENDFLSAQNIDSTKYIADFQTNITLVQSDEASTYQSNQALYTQIASGMFDFAVGELNFLSNYAYGYHFVDLTTVLSKEQIKVFEPYFLYIDLDVLIERQEKKEELPLPDFRNPDAMKKPIPVLVDISHCPITQEIYTTNSSDICYGIIRKNEHQENAIKFLEYLSEGSFK